MKYLPRQNFYPALLLMFSFFKRRPPFGDDEQTRFADAIAAMLRVQLAAAQAEFLPPGCKPKALGYIYGFIDAALRTIGQDMANTAVGIPVTFQVLRRVFPGAERDCMDFLITSIGQDASVMSGMVYGGQQYLEFNNRKLAAPMGLARIIIESRPDA